MRAHAYTNRCRERPLVLRTTRKRETRQFPVLVFSRGSRRGNPQIYRFAWSNRYKCQGLHPRVKRAQFPANFGLAGEPHKEVAAVLGVRAGKTNCGDCSIGAKVVRKKKQREGVGTKEGEGAALRVGAHTARNTDGRLYSE